MATATTLTPLEHHVIRELREWEINEANLLVAVSGGLDSTVLLYILKRISPLLKLKVYAAHIHHGWIHGPQGDFRDRAWHFVRKTCQKWEVPFYSNLLEARPKYRFHREPHQTLKSEEQMRKFRYECLYEYRQQITDSLNRKTFIVLAHNANDLLETRLMRLIRGTGSLGLLAMSTLGEDLLRPLLQMDRNVLADYAKSYGLQFLEDPSNASPDPFRNWIRHEWLPLLEAKRPGSGQSLARSLDQLLGIETNTMNVEEIFAGEGINLQLFLELSPAQKKQILAQYMRLKEMKNYGLSHIKEILKRLDSPEKEHNFVLLKHNWTVNAERIKASPF